MVGGSASDSWLFDINKKKWKQLVSYGIDWYYNLLTLHVHGYHYMMLNNKLEVVNWSKGKIAKQMTDDCMLF